MNCRLIENTIAQSANGSLFQLFRTTAGFLYISWSLDGGFTWFAFSDSIYCYVIFLEGLQLNRRCYLIRIPRFANAQNFPTVLTKLQICMMNLADNGLVVLGYNPSSSQRSPLALTSSSDGVNWDQFVILAHHASVAESCLAHFGF